MYIHLHLLAFLSVLLAPALALPIDPRLINIAPVISPNVDLSNSASCIGVAVCNPVTVNQGGSPPASSQPQQPPPQQTAAPQQGGGAALINVAPVVSPSLNLAGILGCLGVAACNPVNVNKGQP